MVWSKLCHVWINKLTIMRMLKFLSGSLKPLPCLPLANQLTEQLPNPICFSVYSVGGHTSEAPTISQSLQLSKSEASKLWPMGPNLGCCLLLFFLTAYCSKNRQVLHFWNSGKKSKNTSSSPSWALYAINILVSIENSCTPFVYISKKLLTAFRLHQQSWVVARQTLWHANAKIFSIWLFAKSFGLHNWSEVASQMRDRSTVI